MNWAKTWKDEEYKAFLAKFPKASELTNDEADSILVKPSLSAETKRRIAMGDVPKFEANEELLLPRACDEHPKYGGVRSPRTDCKKCWKFYEQRKAMK